MNKGIRQGYELSYYYCDNLHFSLINYKKNQCQALVNYTDFKKKYDKLTDSERTVLKLVENGHKALIFSQFVGHLKIIESLMQKMKEFLKHINSQDIGQLKEELKELYISFEWVRDYYQIKLKQGKMDQNLLSKYKRQITDAIYFDEYGQGGLDVDKAENIIKQLNSDSTLKYYIEISLHAIEECTRIANDFGGDFGDYFFIYFEELYDKVLDLVVKKNLVDKHKDRLKEIADVAFDGYGHYDQLQETYDEYIKE